ncbi:MAG TPA: hypothetical protein VLC47_05110 [Burkholderiales bacterium]|nr:hypothetical protein [Burkholderiales bacterium]
MDTKAAASGAPLQALAALGQSIWLDWVKRGLVESGELAPGRRRQAFRRRI